jgi:hypothetical protein
MRHVAHVASVLVLLAGSVVAVQDGSSALDAAEAAMGTSGLSSLRYVGSGSLSLIGAARTFVQTTFRSRSQAFTGMERRSASGCAIVETIALTLQALTKGHPGGRGE